MQNERAMRHSNLIKNYFFLIIENQNELQNQKFVQIFYLHLFFKNTNLTCQKLP